jgi:hypothetical protein
MINDYIIDFERLNKLTVHENDNPNVASNTHGVPNYCYSITRGLIKEYIKIYMDHLGSRHEPDTKFQKAVEVLHWNKILISAADIRDHKIDELI